MSNTSTNPQLSIYPRSDWLAGYLRADRIRLDTLVQLVAGWSDADNRDQVIAALDAFANIAQAPDATEGALDAAVEAVENVASMDTAQIPLDKTHAVRLHVELGAVVEHLTRFGPNGKTSIPTQQDRRWTA